MAIRPRPGAKTDRVVAVAPAAGGRQELIASVTEPPRNGRANEALRRLSRASRLPRRDPRIVAGACGRRNMVQTTGDPEQLLAYLPSLIAVLPEL